MFWATISAFSPAQPTDTDDPEDDLCRPLWHVVHDDGDEEDLEEHEIKEAIRITERVRCVRSNLNHVTFFCVNYVTQSYLNKST